MEDQYSGTLPDAENPSGRTFTTEDLLNREPSLAITEEQSQAERLEELRERVKQAHLDLEPIDEEFAWLTAKRQIAMGILSKALADYQKHLGTMLAVKL